MGRARLLRTTAAALAITVAATGCVTRDDNSAITVTDESVPVAELAGLTLNVGDQKGNTEALLTAAGELENLPYEVEFSLFTSGPPQIEAATAGKIDFAVTGNTPPVFGAANNAKIKVVSGYVGSGRGDQILIPKDSPIESVEDLKGKKIAIAKGSSAHANVLEQLQKVGLTISDVEPVFLQPADSLGAFQQGAVDAWAIWDPFTALAQEQTGARTLATADDSYGFGVASTTALGDPKRNTAIRDLTERIARAAKWAQANPQEWAEKYAASVDIPPQVAAVAQERSLRPAIPLTDEVVQSEQTLVDLFYKSKQTQRKPDFNGYVDRRYNDELGPYFGT